MVLHKNKWDRKATKAHERKLRAKAEASATGTGGVAAKATGGAPKAVASRKAVGVGSKQTDPAVGTEKKKVEGEEEEDEGGVKVEVEGEGGKGGDDGDDDDEEEEEQEKGKYSRRKIVDNSWRYEEPEEDPYLKAQEKKDQQPEPDYARMTIGKAQLKDSSDEEHEPEADDADDKRALDEIFIRDVPTSTRLPTKRKIVKVDRRCFQDIDEKVAKQKAADAFRKRFALRPPPKAPPPGSHPEIDFGGDDEGIRDIDEFLGELKLEARTPAQGRGSEKTRMPMSGGPGKDLRSEEEDDKWLDEMLESSGARAAAKLQSRR